MPQPPAVIRNLTEWSAWVPPDVARLFWPRAQADRGFSWVNARQQMLRSGNADIEWAYIARLVPTVQTPDSGPGVTVIGQGGQVYQAGVTYQPVAPKDWREANFYYATELASDCPLRLIQETARNFPGQVRQDIPEEQQRAAVAIVWMDLANSQGKLLPELVAEQAAPQGAGRVGPRRRTGWRFTPPARPPVRGAGILVEMAVAAAFSGKVRNGWAKLASDPLEWARRVFLTEPGKALQAIGNTILKARNDMPWLGRFFLDPLLITGVAATLRELGDVMVAGTWAAWSPQTVAGAWGNSLVAGGAVLAAVAPFLPPPFNLVCAAVAAAMIAAGTVILNQLRREAYIGQQQDREQAARRAQAAAQAEADRLAAEAAALAADAGAGALVLGAEPVPGPRAARSWLAWGGAAAALVLGLALWGVNR
jgi:hypothetical protein